MTFVSVLTQHCVTVFPWLKCSSAAVLYLSQLASGPAKHRKNYCKDSLVTLMWSRQFPKNCHSLPLSHYSAPWLCSLPVENMAGWHIIIIWPCCSNWAISSSCSCCFENGYNGATTRKGRGQTGDKLFHMSVSQLEELLIGSEGLRAGRTARQMRAFVGWCKKVSEVGGGVKTLPKSNLGARHRKRKEKQLKERKKRKRQEHKGKPEYNLPNNRYFTNHLVSKNLPALCWWPFPSSSPSSFLVPFWT